LKVAFSKNLADLKSASAENLDSEKSANPWNSHSEKYTGLVKFARLIVMSGRW
jgi:hypothetical protein